VGANCSVNSDCCSNVCNGTCQGIASCLTLGESCAGGGCCSGLCASITLGVDAGTQMVCELGNSCRAQGDICGADSDCCAGVCTKTGTAATGTCEVFSGGCVPDGEPTGGTCPAGSQDTVCCTNQCETTSNGVSVCTPVQGCRPIGEACDPKAPGQCCSGSCIADAAGGGLCTKAVSCAPEGEICKIGSTDNCCRPAGFGGMPGKLCLGTTCTQLAAGQTTCPTGVNGMVQDCLDDPAFPNGNQLCCCTGVRRCYGGCPNGTIFGQGGCCIAAGQTCSFSDECCNGLPCVPDSTGTLRCGSACKNDGATCGSDAECCDGSCYMGVCRLPPMTDAGLTCLPNGQSCMPLDGGTIAMQCCSGMCVGGVCVMSTCVQSGGNCTVNSDCCSPNTCVNGQCGTACAPLGAQCTSGGQCCSGLCSASGTCTFG
jgi:hypothetical protein